MTVVLVGIGGALGAMARYGIGLSIGVRDFPWATLAINLVGTFVLAAVLGAGGESRLGISATNFIAVGVLGGFTTFSAFGYETLTMLRDDRVIAAVGYVGVSVAGGLLAAVVGYSLGRLLS